MRKPVIIFNLTCVALQLGGMLLAKQFDNPYLFNWCSLWALFSLVVVIVMLVKGE